MDIKVTSKAITQEIDGGCIIIAAQRSFAKACDEFDRNHDGGSSYNRPKSFGYYTDKGFQYIGFWF